MAQNLNLDWQPPGPVAAAFMRSIKPVQIINGPIGSGKTTACLIKAVRIAARQMPSTRSGEVVVIDGREHRLRKFKVCVVRDTYRQLWKTTLPSWWKRIPRSVGEFTGAENSPATHKVQFALKDNTAVDFHVDFIAIGENSVEDVLRGYEPTVFYLNEADLLAREVYNYARGRAGRYPDMSEGGPSWYGILMDCNAPELSSWLYLDIFRRTPADVDLFRQPGGFDPHAENLPNLPKGYYENQKSGQPEWYIKRMLENVPGYSRAGKPVFPEFNDFVHVAPFDLEPIPGLALQLGVDAGMHPGGAIGQRMPNGQWRILDELIGEAGMGASRFGEMLAQRLKERYEGWRTIHAWADPSAAYGVDKKAGESSWIEIVAAAAGIRIDPAPTNSLVPRIEAVRRPLSRMIDGKPGFLLSPRCVVLREGFNSGYHFKKLEGADIERYKEEPDKNDHSHPMDGLQYLLSGGGEDIEIRDRKDRGHQAVSSMRHEHEWDPLGA